MKFWKNTITFEIIGIGGSGEFFSIKDAEYAANWGDCSSTWDQSVSELTEEEFLQECEKQGPDPAFFFGEGEEED